MKCSMSNRRRNQIEKCHQGATKRDLGMMVFKKNVVEVRIIARAISLQAHLSKEVLESDDAAPFDTKTQPSLYLIVVPGNGPRFSNQGPVS